MLWYRYWDRIYHARFALLSDFKSSICSTHNSGDILGISLSRQQRSPHNTMLYECTLWQRSTYHCNNLLVLLHCCKGICTRSSLHHEVLAGESDRPQESVWGLNQGAARRSWSRTMRKIFYLCQITQRLQIQQDINRVNKVVVWSSLGAEITTSQKWKYICRKGRYL
jgi:hypothetical protein